MLLRATRLFNNLIDGSLNAAQLEALLADPKRKADMTSLAESRSVVKRLFREGPALNAIVGSQLAMDSIVNSEEAAEAIISSQTNVNDGNFVSPAMSAIAASTIAMLEVVSSPIFTVSKPFVDFLSSNNAMLNTIWADDSILTNIDNNVELKRQLVLRATKRLFDSSVSTGATDTLNLTTIFGTSNLVKTATKYLIVGCANNLGGNTSPTYVNITFTVNGGRVGSAFGSRPLSITDQANGNSGDPRGTIFAKPESLNLIAIDSADPTIQLTSPSPSSLSIGSFSFPCFEIF